MAIKTWTLRQINVGADSRLWWDEAAGAAEAASNTGWEVGNNAAGNYASLEQGLEVPRGTFAATILPNTTAPNVDNSYANIVTYAPPTLLNSTDSISTLYEYVGVFPAGTWTFNFPVRAVSSGGVQDGRISMRVFKGLRSGNTWASVTELTTARLQGTIVTNLATTVTQTSTVSWVAPAFNLNNEFLICKLAWEITGAGGANTRDVNLRWGTTATMVSPNFKKQRHIIS